MPRVASTPDVRGAILDAATRLMERYGYKKMTIDDIAHEAGIGKATIYGYFEHKQDVALGVIDGYRQRNLERWGEIMQERLPVEQTLRKLLVARVGFAFDTCSRYNQSVDDSLATLRPVVLAKRGRYNESDAEALAPLLQEGIGQGMFGEMDCLAVARTILTCFSSLMPYNLSPRELTQREQVIRMAEDMVDLILQGLFRQKDRF